MPRERIWGLAFLVPALLFFGAFSIYPMLYSFYISLFQYDLLSPKVYIGLENYRSLIGDPLFLNSLKVTLIYVFGASVPVWFLSLGLALLLNGGLRAKGLFRTLFFIPVVMSLVVVSMIWKQLYQPYGPVNQFLNTLLHTQIQADWTANKDLALPGLILVNIWKNLGYFMVIYLAGLQAIPLTVYEAARIDGAGAWAQFRYMTLPLLKPTTAFVMIVSIINAFNAFATIFVMTKGGPGDSTRVLSLLLYETAFDFLKMGRAAAISVVIFAIILVLTLLQLKLTKANHTS